MVIGRYSLPPSKARLCRGASIVFFVEAMLWALAMAAQMTSPGFTLNCKMGQTCERSVDVVGLLPEDARASVRQDPAATARLVGYVGRPAVHAGMAAVALVENGLMAFLLLSIAITLRRLGNGGHRVLERALPWLKRGALAGVFWSLFQPASDCIRAAVLYPVTPGETFYLPLDLSIAGPALLMAIAAYAVAWALEAGVRAEQDLADFV